jgi:glycosyltransferase involved in cell wall biosynthesis
VKVSALIPTYNRRTQVLRAIDSVFAQTAPVDEIIVVDDGSTDGTADAIRSRYGSRVAVFRQENAGVAAARNQGLREARGEWVAFLDSDDVWFPTKIQRQLEAVAVLGGEFGLCFTDCVYSGSPDMKRSLFQDIGFEGAPRLGLLEEPAKYMVARREPFLHIPSFLVLRSLVEKIGGFDDALFIGEDSDMVFRLSFKARFCFVAEPLVEVDRTRSRDVGLCDLYSARDDRKYESLERRYTKWLAMAEVAGRAEYERPIREMLREVCFDSAEAKIHQLRIGPALREIGRLKALGYGYASIGATLLSRKIAKVQRSIGGIESTAVRAVVQ